MEQEDEGGGGQGARQELQPPTLPPQAGSVGGSAGGGSASSGGGAREGAEEPTPSNVYTPEEVTALRGIFNTYDSEGAGTITLQELNAVLMKIGHTPEDREHLIAMAGTIASDAKIGFDDFVTLLEQAGPVSPMDGPDPKVMEFLRILEEYRLKCEAEGNYLEAGRAYRQLDVLRKQEIKRQQKAMRARQLGERQDVQEAHDMQFQDFTAAWERYLSEYDRMAHMYIQQMTERHAVALLELQQRLQKEAQERPPKWSKELLDWRRRQHLLARQHNYAEAQKVKKIADQLEDSERETMGESHSLYVARKESGFRQQQQAELQALLKRIDARRREHLKQRALDSKRLLQRNRNVQAVLEAKQATEGQRLLAEIRRAVLEGTSAYAVRAAAAAAAAGGGDAAPAHGGRGGSRGKKAAAAPGADAIGGAAAVGGGVGA